MAKVWVKVPPATDPALIGKERCRKPEMGKGNIRWFTSEPEEVEETAAIMRLIHNGSLVLVEKITEKTSFNVFEK